MPGWTPQGLWMAYNPTLSGSGWNGTGASAVGSYMIDGRGTCFFQQQVTLGAGSSISASAVPIVSLPFPAPAGQNNTQINVELIDSGFNTYRGLGAFSGTGPHPGVSYFAFGASGAYQSLGPAIPFTWSPGDSFGSTGWFKLAA